MRHLFFVAAAITSIAGIALADACSTYKAPARCGRDSTTAQPTPSTMDTTSGRGTDTARKTGVKKGGKKRGGRTMVMPSPPPPPPPPARLSPASLRVATDDTLRVGISSDVRITIARDSMLVLNAAPVESTITDASGTRTHVVRTQTKVGDNATVCLRADTTNFAISGGDSRTSTGDGSCAARAISDAVAPWVFHVVPRDTGVKGLEVEVRASFNDMPNLVVYDSTYRYHIYVAKEPSITERIVSWLDDWKKVLVAIGGVIAAVAAIVTAWRKIVGGEHSGGGEGGPGEGGSGEGAGGATKD